MFISPSGFQTLAHADSQYINLATTDWHSGNRTITYGYDANGSVETKTVRKTLPDTLLETCNYEYNLRNRLAKMTKAYTDGGSVEEITSYTYNENGIRVKAEYVKNVDSSPVTQWTKTFLIDSYNHTGYAQTIEEWSPSGSVPDVTYTIGDDVITQATSSTIEHFLYDGHGSTRQMVDNSQSITDCISYDAYGVMVGYTGTPSTNLRYAGEYYDNDLSQYNLRARWYDQSTGRFNRVDPYSGNTSDPQSLHKYLYCHANPVNQFDPLGKFSLPEVLTVNKIAAIAIGALAPAIITAYETAKTGASWWQIGRNAAIAWGLSFAAGLAIAAAAPYILNIIVSAMTQIPGVSATMVNMALAVVLGALAVSGLVTLWSSDYPLSVKISITAVVALSIAVAFCAKNNIKTGGRLGKPSTRAQNRQLARTLKRRGYEITHGGGEKPEEYLRGTGPGTRGGNFIDTTARHKGTGRVIRINTVDTLVDGVTPDAREARNAAMIRSKLPPGDHLVLIPKVGG